MRQKRITSYFTKYLPISVIFNCRCDMEMKSDVGEKLVQLLDNSLCTPCGRTLSQTLARRILCLNENDTEKIMAENIAINLIWFSEIIYEILLTSNPQVYGKSSKHEFQERIGGIVAAAHEPPMSRQKPASHQICSPVNISKS